MVWWNQNHLSVRNTIDMFAGDWGGKPWEDESWSSILRPHEDHMRLFISMQTAGSYQDLPNHNIELISPRESKIDVILDHEIAMTDSIYYIKQ
jgi:hypothetical protein